MQLSVTARARLTNNNIFNISTSLLAHLTAILNSPKPLKFRGLGQADYDYIDISLARANLRLRWTFSLAGFARTKTEDKNKLLPCPKGTFVKPPTTVWFETNEILCTKCPAGI